MNEKKYPAPKFSSPEQEEEYWKTHSPLDEGYKGEIQKTKQKRASFLSIRLTGEELTQLRDIAAKLGMGPSTYARQILRLELERNWNAKDIEQDFASKISKLNAELNRANNIIAVLQNEVHILEEDMSFSSRRSLIETVKTIQTQEVNEASERTKKLVLD